MRDAGQTMKVLMIEDDKRIATTVKRGLEAEGFVVDATFDGVDGLWMATEGSYDVIILDLMLPGRNGFRCAATCERRATGRRSSCSRRKRGNSTKPKRWTQGPTTI